MNETFRDYLRRRLTSPEVSQSAVGKLLGIPQSTINRIARGDCNPTLPTTEKLLRFFWSLDGITLVQSPTGLAQIPKEPPR